MMIIKLALIGIGGSLLAAITKQYRKEYSLLLLLGLALILNGYLVTELHELITFIQDISKRAGLSDTYLRILFKLLAISFVSQFSSGLCEDMGYKSVAFALELFGKLSILVLCIPVFHSLLETIDHMI